MNPGMWQIPYPHLDVSPHEIWDYLRLRWLPQIKTDNLKEGRNIQGENRGQLDLKNTEVLLDRTDLYYKTC